MLIVALFLGSACGGGRPELDHSGFGLHRTSQSGADGVSRESEWCSGSEFTATVLDTGFLMLSLGAISSARCVLPILLLGLFVFRMPLTREAYRGHRGNPAILAYINRLVPTKSPTSGMPPLSRHDHRQILFVSIVPALMCETGPS